MIVVADGRIDRGDTSVYRMNASQRNGAYEITASRFAILELDERFHLIERPSSVRAAIDDGARVSTLSKRVLDAFDAPEETGVRFSNATPSALSLSSMQTDRYHSLAGELHFPHRRTGPSLVAPVSDPQSAWAACGRIDS